MCKELLFVLEPRFCILATFWSLSSVSVLWPHFGNYYALGRKFMVLDIRFSRETSFRTSSFLVFMVPIFYRGSKLSSWRDFVVMEPLRFDLVKSLWS